MYTIYAQCAHSSCLLLRRYWALTVCRSFAAGLCRLRPARRFPAVCRGMPGGISRFWGNGKGPANRVRFAGVLLFWADLRGAVSVWRRKRARGGLRGRWRHFGRVPVCVGAFSRGFSWRARSGANGRGRGLPCGAGLGRGPGFGVGVSGCAVRFPPLFRSCGAILFPRAPLFRVGIRG